MAIFLTILKIIGIVLLCIIGLILVIILYVLLTPFWFKLEALVDRELNYDIRFKATSFLHFIQVHVNLKKDEDLVFDGTVVGTLVKVFPKDDKGEDDKEKSTEVVESSDDSIDKIEDKKVDEVSESTENKETNTGSQSEDEDNKISEETVEATSDSRIITSDTSPGEDSIEEEKEEKPGVWEKIKSFFHKLNPKNWGPIIRKKIEELKIKIKNLIKDLKEKKEKIIAIINDPQNKEWFKKIFTQLKKLIKSLRLNMRGTDIDFSIGEPDSTGLVSGGLSLFPPTYDKKVRILPDFQSDDLYLDGKIVLKGKIQIISVVIMALVIITDANTKRILKLLK